MEQEYFDIERLQSNFKAALKDETDVVLDFYLEGFKELCKYVLQSFGLSDIDFFLFLFRVCVNHALLSSCCFQIFSIDGIRFWFY